MVKYLWLLVLLASPVFSFGQKKADKRLTDNLQQHILTLSADSTAGRAADYLENQFRSAGFSPLNNSYRQPMISEGDKQYSPGTNLVLNDTSLDAGRDFVPLPYSAQGSAEGSPLIAVQEENEPWLIDLANTLDPQTSYPDSMIRGSMYVLAQKAAGDHARAVLFYDSEGAVQLPPALPAEHMKMLPVPVVFINPAASKRYLRDPTASVDIRLQVSFSQKKDTAYNIVGAVNNGAAQTIVIGAHDAGDKATLIELGRLLKQDKHFNRENYLLAAFGEGGNTPGEKYFFEHPPEDLSGLNCVIDLNREGSNTAGAVLQVSGKLSPEWTAFLDKVKDKDVVIKQDTASDYSGKTGIPVLSFSRGKGDHAEAADELKGIKFLAGLIREINRTTK